MTKSIHLSQGKVTQVDDEDFEFLNQWKWSYRSDGRAVRCDKSNKIIRMHRVIMNAPAGTVVDHINGDTLDNRKINLRICSQKENTLNHRRNKNNVSGYKGVSWSKKAGKWRAYIAPNRKQISLGCFMDVIEAARAYDKAAKKLFGKFANLNFP